MNIFIGLIGIIISFLVIIYREGIVRIIGKINWAEEHLGSGGTYTMLLLFGLAGFFLSLVILTGSLDLFFSDGIALFFGSK